MKLSLVQRLVVALARRLERRRPWSQRRPLVGLFMLMAMRIELRQLNLHDSALLPEAEPQSVPMPPTERQERARDAAGRYNDLAAPRMGSSGTRFGRNVPFAGCVPEPEPQLMTPSPRIVSNELLARNGQMAPVPFLNLHAASWIQFMIHDWVSHGPGVPERRIAVPLAADDDWPQPPMEVLRTPPDVTRAGGDGPPAFTNTETHWWDGSQVYGSSAEIEAALRAPDGTLILDAAGLLPLDEHGIDRTGVSGNWWLGLALLHNLFAREHNDIVTELRRAYPQWGPERLFDQARLINAAVMAKIHTIEWTPGLLPMTTTTKAMLGNWYGLLGPRGSRFLRRFTRSDLLIGIPGSKPDHHGAGYTLTEEFIAVYRLHGLIPDEFAFETFPDRSPAGQRSMTAVTGAGARSTLNEIGLRDAMFSFGVGHPGLLELHNFPDTLRRLERHGRLMDLATVDVLRDRERGVPRYNEFRRQLRMTPAATFAELAARPEWADELERVYGDVERVDLMVGLYAERRLPGFAISETAFRIFVLMASRRLKSDRFFTDDYRPEIYTPEGMRRIERTTMTAIIARQVPELAGLMADVKNAFGPWDDPANRHSGRAELPVG